MQCQGHDLGRHLSHNGVTAEEKRDEGGSEEVFSTMEQGGRERGKRDREEVRQQVLEWTVQGSAALRWGAVGWLAASPPAARTLCSQRHSSHAASARPSHVTRSRSNPTPFDVRPFDLLILFLTVHAAVPETPGAARHSFRIGRGSAAPHSPARLQQANRVDKQEA